MKYKYLSHMLKERMPVYGGRAAFGIKKTKSIAAGDAANVYRLTMENHWGTHIDAPNHFFEGGENITDYEAGYWLFNHPHVVEVTLGRSEILGPGKWIDRIDRRADIVIVKSGWSRRREKKAYVLENPGISPEVGYILRKSRPKIRAIGIDWISISPFKRKVEGRAAHRAFLDPDGAGRPIPIIEDMDLTDSLKGLKKLFVFPLRISDVDSAPCVVVGAFDD